MSKTIEEKARAYDRALEKAREYWETDDDNTLDIKARGTMEYLFPELRESEDEKIKKVIIGLLKQSTYEDCVYDGVNMKDIYAWLEKQGQKSAWTKEDEWKFSDILALLRGGENCHYNTPDLFDWLKSLKDRVQPQNWTEEDKERYISCLQRLGTGNPDQPETINSKWFKEHVTSLPQWKPDKKQMYFLNWLANVKLGDSVVEQEVSKNLNELYNDLTKL